MKSILCLLVISTLSFNQGRVDKFSKSNSVIYQGFERSGGIKKNRRSVEIFNFPFTQEDCKYAVLRDTRLIIFF